MYISILTLLPSVYFPLTHSSVEISYDTSFSLDNVKEVTALQRFLPSIEFKLIEGKVRKLHNITIYLKIKYLFIYPHYFSGIS